MGRRIHRDLSEAEREVKRARARADYPRHRAARAERYRRIDARKRFADLANRKVTQTYGRSGDILDWQTIPDGPWTCRYCGIACEGWDHVEPLSLGGANHASNLVPSCVPCNQRRTAKALRAEVPLKTHCKRGHELAGENIRLDGKGIRRCRACGRVYAVESYWRKRAAA